MKFSRDEEFHAGGRERTQWVTHVAPPTGFVRRDRRRADPALVARLINLRVVLDRYGNLVVADGGGQ
jgi:hypothetical protein